MSPAMVDHMAAGIMKKYNEQLLPAVQRMLPELNIQEAKSLDDPNRNVLDEKAIVHVIARDKRRNKYGLIIQVGSQEPGENILEVANAYQEEIIYGGLGGSPEKEFKATYVIFLCRIDPFGKGKPRYEYYGGKYNKETHQTSAAPNVIFINIDGDPTITNIPKKSSYKPKAIESEGTVDSITTNEINEFLTTFFKLYPTATASELSYYVNDGILKPIGKEYIFQELVNPIHNRKDNQVTVSLTVEYIDQQTKATQASQFDLVLEKNGSNWKIVK